MNVTEVPIDNRIWPEEEVVRTQRTLIADISRKPSTVVDI